MEGAGPRRGAVDEGSAQSPQEGTPWSAWTRPPASEPGEAEV